MTLVSVAHRGALARQLRKVDAVDVAAGGLHLRKVVVDDQVRSALVTRDKATRTILVWRVVRYA